MIMVSEAGSSINTSFLTIPELGCPGQTQASSREVCLSFLFLLCQFQGIGHDLMRVEWLLQLHLSQLYSSINIFIFYRKHQCLPKSSQQSSASTLLVIVVSRGDMGVFWEWFSLLGLYILPFSNKQCSVRQKKKQVDTEQEIHTVYNSY